MISPLLLLALAAPVHSSAPPPNPNTQRQAFTHCLAESLATDLHANTAVDAFKAKLATICKSEEAAFRDASVRSDLAVGIKSAAAQQNAASEIKDITETQAERYKSYFETKTFPK
jgi:hypothetical protein